LYTKQTVKHSIFLLVLLRSLEVDANFSDRRTKERLTYTKIKKQKR